MPAVAPHTARLSAMKTCSLRARSRGKMAAREYYIYTVRDPDENLYIGATIAWARLERVRGPERI
jgi:hypothetical protein